MSNAVWSLVFHSLAVFVLIAVNGLWVAAEFAIVRARRTRLEELAGQGVDAAKHAIEVVDRLGDYLALTQIGVTVASLAVGWLAEDAVAELLGLTTGPARALASALAFGAVSVLVVVAGEQVPKLIAVRRAEHYVLLFARPLRVAHVLLRPLLRVLEQASSWILQHLGHGVTESPPLTEDELKLVLAESQRGGVVTEGEAEIIVRAFEFADKQSEEIMIPAECVTYFSLARSLEANLALARSRGHARFPLCAQGLDSVIGTVSMKDLWSQLERERSMDAFVRVARPPILIPLDYSQDDILKAFRTARGQMGIVRDRSGARTLGIVTLEDVLDALIGDVRESKLPASAEASRPQPKSSSRAIDKFG